MSELFPPPPSAHPRGVAVKPSNYLVWAILSTVFCCLPFGVVAIVKAASVDSLWASGNHDAAYAASAQAKKWTIVAVVTWAVFAVLWFAYLYLLVATATQGF